MVEYKRIVNIIKHAYFNFIGLKEYSWAGALDYLRNSGIEYVSEVVDFILCDFFISNI